MDVERLYQEYQEEVRKLVAINEKHDFSAAGDAEYDRQSNRVATAKYRLVLAQKRQQEETTR